MPENRKAKREYTLKNRCRGRFGYPSSLREGYEMCGRCTMNCRDRDPWEEKVYVPGKGYVSSSGYDKMENCVILFSRARSYDCKGNEWHTCMCEMDQTFVKRWDMEKRELELTRREEEACQFFSDEEVDSCMEYIKEKHDPWTIATWNYQGDAIKSEVAHYPNEYWACNDRLQPSLMYEDVIGWHERKDIKVD